MSSQGSQPVLLGEAGVRVDAVAAVTVVRSALGASLASSLETDGKALVCGDRARARGCASYRGIADGNRSVVIGDVRVEIGGRGYALSVKGIGASTAPYGDAPLDYALASDFDPADAGRDAPVTSPRAIAVEAWMGEAPFGAQGEAGARQALEITALADGASIAGLYVCPTLAVAEIPGELVERERFWYRRYRGRALQEHRLVPSNVRLYHASPRALGQSPGEVLDAFGVDDDRALDAFVERYLASGTAALTLFARTLREGAEGPEGLDYDDVWLDKDSVVAPDGTLHFVDLEALEWTPAAGAAGLARRVTRQVNRNCYELLYGLDAVLREGERRAGSRPSPRERRAVLADRWEMAVAGDPYVEMRRGDEGLDLVVRPRGPMRDEVVVRLLDDR